MTLHSEIWGEIEKPGRMMDTRAFIGDGHQGLPNTCQVSVSVSRRVTEFPRFCLRILKIPLGAYSIFACFMGRLLKGRQAK